MQPSQLPLLPRQAPAFRWLAYQIMHVSVLLLAAAAFVFGFDAMPLMCRMPSEASMLRSRSFFWTMVAKYRRMAW